MVKKKYIYHSAFDVILQIDEQAYFEVKFVFRGKQLCTFNLNIIKNYNVDTLVLLSMHSNPWYPLSHPFIHVPLMC